METSETYPKSMMHFHILGFILILIAYLSIALTDMFPKGSILKNVIFQTHFFVGILVLLLIIPRFIIRTRNIKSIPPIVPEISKINQFLAHVGHIALYIWMIVMPLLGIALVSAKMGYINLYGLHIPGIIPQNKDIAATIQELHEMCGDIGILLIGGHGLIALWHHFKMKDTTLIRMFPQFQKK